MNKKYIRVSRSSNLNTIHDITQMTFSDVYPGWDRNSRSQILGKALGLAASQATLNNLFW